jgi:hypothetical protein
MYIYTLLVCRALGHKDKMIKHYNSISLGVRLANVIAGFHNVTGNPNLCGAKGMYTL